MSSPDHLCKERFVKKNKKIQQQKLFTFLSGADPEETILNAFKVFDPEGTGTLKKD